MLRLLPKKATHVAKNFRSCKKSSQLSVDIFMASGDLLVVQTILSEKSTKEKISGRRFIFAHMRNVEKFINASDSYSWCLEIIRKQKVDLCYIISYPPPALQKRKDIHSDLFVNVFVYVFVFLLSLDPKHFTTIIQQHQRKKLALLQIPFKCKSHYSGDFPHRNACVDIRE